MKSTFIRFLHLKDALTGHHVNQEIDLLAQRLLEVAVLKHARDETFTVTEAMKMSELASPATIHRKLDALIDNGYVTLEYKGKNRRSKFITPTQKTDQYFDQLGKVIAQSLA